MKSKVVLLGTLSFLFMAFSACKKDNDPNDPSNGQKGQVTIEITDAPVDDAQVKSVFVTVAGIKIDGHSVDGFSKTTIDLMAYQNGNTKSLGTYEMDAKAYSNITLILDFDQDENGNSPGCYVMDLDGTKHKLTTNASNEVNMNYTFTNESSKENKLVIDFDLRKTIKREQSGSSEYAFVSSAELNNAVRVVSRDKAGTIKGNCDDSFSNSDMIVVYSYKKGTYNRNTEVQGSAQSGLKFHNAVNSAKVDANGNFELHFLEEGEYEIHFAAYTHNQGSGKMELTGTLMLEVLSAIDLGSISLNASATLTVNVLVIGVVPV
jgi:hypothetical protein